MLTRSRPSRLPQHLHALLGGALSATAAVALWIVTVQSVAWYIHFVN